jgi:hypothetical protein
MLELRVLLEKQTGTLKVKKFLTVYLAQFIAVFTITSLVDVLL